MILFGIRVSETTPLVEKKQLDDIEYNMDRHELVDCVKREAVQSGSASLFHYPDPTFDLVYVLVGTHQFDYGSNWHGFDQGLKICEFTVSIYRSDVENTL
jgi:hypothetical protein